MAYLVEFYGGDYDEEFITQVFVTFSKETAERYVRKFNEILERWKEYYSYFLDPKTGFLKEEYFADVHYNRVYALSRIDAAVFTEIEIR